MLRMKEEISRAWSPIMVQPTSLRMAPLHSSLLLAYFYLHIQPRARVTWRPEAEFCYFKKVLFTLIRRPNKVDLRPILAILHHVQNVKIWWLANFFVFNIFLCISS